jgi:type I restriction enzyme S subunit
MEEVMDEKATEVLPKLRFPQYAGPWKKGPIGKHIEFVSGVALPGSEISEEKGGVAILRGINITEGSVRHSSDIDRYYHGSLDGIDHLLLKEGDLVLGMDGSKVGKNTAVISKDDEGSLLIQRVARIRPTGTASIEFIYHHIFSYRFHDYVDVVNTSSGIPHISGKQIRDFEVAFPTLPEQQKIAAFLGAVDRKIQQLKRKQALLEQYKKGVVQQLFSQELRFKREDGGEFPEWEENRLDAFVSEFIVPMRDKPKVLKGPIPWCRLEDFDGTYLSGSKTGQGVTEDVVKAMNLKIFPKGTLLVSCSANLGFCAITQVPLVTNQTFIGLVPNGKKVNTEFLYYLMLHSSHRLNTLSSGTTISYLSREAFEEFPVVIPSLEQQSRIAGFLMALDAKVAGVAEAVAAAQKWKKGLLQQMFG